MVRIEIDRRAAPPTPRQAHDLALRLSPLARRLRATALQIDFDARRSERGFYRALLEEFRRLLPPGTALSITALASWCLGDPWLDGLPIDEAVPMLFRMGPEAGAIRVRLARGDDFTLPVCRRSVGLSTDEPRPGGAFARRLRSRAVYLFHPHPWTRDAVAAAREELDR